MTRPAFSVKNYRHSVQKHLKFLIGLGFFMFVNLGCAPNKAEQILMANQVYREGPHIVMNGKISFAFYFSLDDGKWTLSKEEIKDPETAQIVVENPVIEAFNVQLRPKGKPGKIEFDDTPKITVIADIEGNFKALIALLKSHQVIDANGNWIYQDGHLVMLGDLFDRGPDVTPMFWFLYKLEQEARDAGGYVHTLLGNHEVMIFEDDTRYINSKYKAQSNDTGMSYAYLYSANTVLGQWLRSKPAIIKIGDKLFSHAGIGPAVLALQLSLREINDLVLEKNLYRVTDDSSPYYETLFGSEGIFWYRGWVDDPPSVTVLDEILLKYRAGHIIIGHTIVPNIQASFNYKLVMADLHQPKDINLSPVRALSIEGDNFYEINSNGERRLIESS